MEARELRDRRIKATEEEIACSLEGNWRDDMLFELREAVNAYDFIQGQIAECDQRLHMLLAALAPRMPAKGQVRPTLPLNRPR